MSFIFEVVRVDLRNPHRAGRKTYLKLDHQLGELPTVYQDDSLDRTGKFDCLRAENGLCDEHASIRPLASEL